MVDGFYIIRIADVQDVDSVVGSYGKVTIGHYKDVVGPGIDRLVGLLGVDPSSRNTVVALNAVSQGCHPNQTPVVYGN